MRAILILGLAGLALAGCGVEERESASSEHTLLEKPPGPALTHNVFFELKRKDEASVQALIDGCYEYLAPHDGIVYFSAGPRHQEYQRDVNDQTFDVALTIVFESTAAQEAYQVTQPHKQFIARLEDNWASVRVFDSLAPQPGS